MERFDFRTVEGIIEYSKVVLGGKDYSPYLRNMNLEGAMDWIRERRIYDSKINVHNAKNVLNDPVWNYLLDSFGCKLKTSSMDIIVSSGLNSLPASEDPMSLAATIENRSMNEKTYSNLFEMARFN